MRAWVAERRAQLDAFGTRADALEEQVRALVDAGLDEQA